MKPINNTEYIQRKPIKINEHAVALIQIFKKHDSLEDLWFLDSDYIRKETWKEAAEEFINQFDQQYCDAFLEELSIGLIKLYKNNRDKVGCTDDFKKLLDKINVIK